MRGPVVKKVSEDLGTYLCIHHGVEGRVIGFRPGAAEVDHYVLVGGYGDPPMSEPAILPPTVWTLKGKGPASDMALPSRIIVANTKAEVVLVRPRQQERSPSDSELMCMLREEIPDLGR